MQTQPRSADQADATRPRGAGWLAALLAACAPVHSGAPAASPPTPAVGQTAAAAEPAAVRSMLPVILADASRRSGSAVEHLRIASVQAVTWSDGALGCPQPGRMYTQALVPGWRIEVAAPAVAALLYRASQRGGWVWCTADRATPALPASPALGT